VTAGGDAGVWTVILAQPPGVSVPIVDTAQMSPAAALVCLHVAVALFGFAALFGKWIALSPIAIVLGRTLVAAFTLALVMRIARHAIARPDRGFAQNGVLLACHWVAFFAAVQAADVATALLGFASFPVFVLLLTSWREHRRPSALELSSVALVVLGLALVVREASWSSRSVQGLAWGVVAGFTFALLALRNRMRVQQENPVTLALWQNAFAALALLPVTIVVYRDGVPAMTFTEVGLIVVLGVACTGLAHSLFVASMRRVSAHVASVVTALEPVYGIAWAALFLHETPDARTLAGGGLILIAATLASRDAGRG